MVSNPNTCLELVPNPRTCEKLVLNHHICGKLVHLIVTDVSDKTFKN